ncbi:MAG: tyrosine/phenylalanine carboxypeptidase domain-containing protein [Myxococcota bacterium]
MRPISHSSERQRILAIDRRLIEIASWLIPDRLLNPTLASRQRAIEQVRQALRLRRMVSPRLDYLPLPMDTIDASARALDAVPFGDTDVDQLLQEQAQALHMQLDLLKARGTPHYGQVATTIYGLPTEALAARAREILCDRYLTDTVPVDSERESTGPLLAAQEMAEEMRRALRDMSIHGWRVLITDEMSARMSVSARHREVRVKTDSMFTREDRDRLIVHELGVHVRRACNGFSTGLLNIGLGLCGYIATEEGLASAMEERNGLLRRSHIKMYAWRALGAHFGHTLSFAETFEALSDLGASPSLAWDVTLRVKRGLEDTDIPGCFPKDYVYLHGRELVSEYLNNGGSTDDLYLGKIAIEHIPRIKRMLRDWDFAATAA